MRSTSLDELRHAGHLLRSVVHRDDDAPDVLTEGQLHALGHGLHFFVRERYGGVAEPGSQVGDESEIQNLRTHLSRGHDIRYRGHGGDIGASARHGFDLGRRLVAASRLEEGHTTMERDPPVERATRGNGEQFGVVGVAHGRELGAELHGVTSGRRIRAVEADVASNADDVAQHQVAGDGADRVGQDELTHSASDHKSRQEHDIADGMSFVEVGASLQHHDRDTAQMSPPQLAGVSGCGGRGAVGDVAIAAALRVHQELGHVAESGSERDAHLRD